MAETCIGFGEFTGKCSNDAGTPWTPLWCLRCDELRRAAITKQLEGIVASFPSPNTTEDREP
jgi:hypothetical protein